MEPDYKPNSPFRVVYVDQFQGHHEDGYGPVGEYKSLDEAISVARKFTEEAIREAESVNAWDGMGMAGLVYDANHMLVWDGVVEGRAGRLGKKSGPN
jgi:hypothetical protein